MAQLPTITVSNEQAAELLEVFGSVANYRKWLKRELWKAVKKERRRAAFRTAIEQAEGDFSDIAPEGDA